MAKSRKFVAYRRIERPYTRISKYKKNNYIKAKPSIHIVRYDMGDATKTYPFAVHLVSRTDLQIRHNAIEAGRQTANRLIETKLGKIGYHFKIRKYPHHVLRENPLASGAGADRMSTGMKCSFGKPIGNAIQVRKGEKVMTISTSKDNIDTAKLALLRAAKKLPNSYMVTLQSTTLR